MNDKRCSKCGQHNARVNGGYCQPCSKEYKRDWKVRRGIMRIHGPVRPPKPGALVNRPVLPDYHSLHTHLRRDRGKASEYVCVCGNRAEEWAYQHNDTNPVIGINRGRRVEYSLDYNKYKPMCKPCHTRFDMSRSNFPA